MGEPLPSRIGPCAAEVVSRSLDVPSNVGLKSLIREHRSLHRGQHVYRQNDPASEVYFLLDGALKAYRTGLDGQEGVVRFYLPRQLVWTDGTASGQRSMSVVSIDDSRICSLPITALQRLMSDYPTVQVRCYELLRQLIADEQIFIGLLCHASAERRLAFLLTQLCRQRYATYLNGLGLRMPMSRADIGNYLGLGVQTVSRTFTRLEDRGIVEVRGRKVILTDLPALELIAIGDDDRLSLTAHKEVSGG